YPASRTACHVIAHESFVQCARIAGPSLCLHLHWWGDRIAWLNLDVGRADYLGPFLRFLGNEFAETRWRERKLSTTFVVKPDLYFGIGECGVDFTVELADNFGRRVVRGSDAEPSTRLVARYEVSYGRDVGQHLRARSGCYRQCTQFAGLNLLDGVNWHAK